MTEKEVKAQEPKIEEENEISEGEIDECFEEFELPIEN